MRSIGERFMPPEIITWWYLFRLFIKKNNGWFGEVVTATATLFYTLLSIMNIDDAALMRSIQVLAQNMSTDLIFGLQLAAALTSLAGIVLMPIHPYEMRYIRLIGSVVLFVWWSAMAWGLAIAMPWHPLIVIYLTFPIYSGWAALAVLHERLD